MRRTALKLASSALLILTLAGCSGGGANGSGSDRDDARDVDLDDVMSTVASRLRLEVRGAHDFSFDGDVDLLTTLINDPAATPLRFLSVGLTTMVTLRDGTAFRVAFDFPGRFDGAGEYELAPVGGAQTVPSVDPENPDPNAAVAGFSRAFVVFNPEGNADEEPGLIEHQQSFEVIVEPCRLVVEDDDGEAGSLSCPELAHTDGRTVSLEMEWDKR